MKELCSTYCPEDYRKATQVDNGLTLANGEVMDLGHNPHLVDDLNGRNQSHYLGLSSETSNPILVRKEKTSVSI